MHRFSSGGSGWRQGVQAPTPWPHDARKEEERRELVLHQRRENSFDSQSDKASDSISFDDSITDEQGEEEDLERQHNQAAKILSEMKSSVLNSWDRSYSYRSSLHWQQGASVDNKWTKEGQSVLPLKKRKFSSYQFDEKKEPSVLPSVSSHQTEEADCDLYPFKKRKEFFTQLQQQEEKELVRNKFFTQWQQLFGNDDGDAEEEKEADNIIDDPKVVAQNEHERDQEVVAHEEYQNDHQIVAHEEHQRAQSNHQAVTPEEHESAHQVVAHEEYQHDHQMVAHEEYQNDHQMVAHEEHQRAQSDQVVTPEEHESDHQVVTPQEHECVHHQVVAHEEHQRAENDHQVVTPEEHESDHQVIAHEEHQRNHHQEVAADEYMGSVATIDMSLCNFNELLRLSEVRSDRLSSMMEAQADKIANALTNPIVASTSSNVLIGDDHREPIQSNAIAAVHSTDVLENPDSQLPIIENDQKPNQATTSAEELAPSVVFDPNPNDKNKDQEFIEEVNAQELPQDMTEAVEDLERRLIPGPNIQEQSRVIFENLDWNLTPTATDQAEADEEFEDLESDQEQDEEAEDLDRRLTPGPNKQELSRVIVQNHGWNLTPTASDQEQDEEDEDLDRRLAPGPNKQELPRVILQNHEWNLTPTASDQEQDEDVEDLDGRLAPGPNNQELHSVIFQNHGWNLTPTASDEEQDEEVEDLDSTLALGPNEQDEETDDLERRLAPGPNNQELPRVPFENHEQFEDPGKKSTPALDSQVLIGEFEDPGKKLTPDLDNRDLIKEVDDSGRKLTPDLNDGELVEDHGKKLSPDSNDRELLEEVEDPGKKLTPDPNEREHIAEVEDAFRKLTPDPNDQELIAEVQDAGSKLTPEPNAQEVIAEVEDAGRKLTPDTNEQDFVNEDSTDMIITEEVVRKEDFINEDDSTDMNITEEVVRKEDFINEDSTDMIITEEVVRKEVHYQPLQRMVFVQLPRRARSKANRTKRKHIVSWKSAIFTSKDYQEHEETPIILNFKLPRRGRRRGGRKTRTDYTSLSALFSSNDKIIISDDNNEGGDQVSDLYSQLKKMRDEMVPAEGSEIDSNMQDDMTSANQKPPPLYQPKYDRIAGVLQPKKGKVPKHVYIRELLAITEPTEIPYQRFAYIPR